MNITNKFNNTASKYCPINHYNISNIQDASTNTSIVNDKSILELTSDGILLFKSF